MTKEVVYTCGYNLKVIINKCKGKINNYNIYLMLIFINNNIAVNNY
jgi:hypothetical protein